MAVPAIREFSAGLPAMRDRFEGFSKFHQIIGQSQAMLDVLDEVRRAGQTDAAVLIHGEAGTGKELIAGAVHQAGHRRHKPWITVNLSAFPRELIECELFGRVGGEETETQPGRIGRFEAADGGTLFLESIELLDPALQNKLLRAVVGRAITPAGSDRECSVDVRVIAATRRRPSDLLNEGLLSLNLYEALAGNIIELPPLRERSGDVRLLVDAFVQELCHAGSRPIPSFAPELIQYLNDHEWPENVGQLRRCIECLLDLGSEGPLTLQDLPMPFRNGSQAKSTGPQHHTDGRSHRTEQHLDENGNGDERPARDEAQQKTGGADSEHVVAIRPGMKLRDLERMAIEQSLQYFHGNRKETANSLGISTRTLQRKLKQWRTAANS
jgi:DNA-binding NtrC family response regulator